MQTNKDLLDKNHPNTILNMYGGEVNAKELFVSLVDNLVDNNAEDFVKSGFKRLLLVNIIHEIDSVLTQQYLENIDYSKYTVFK